MWQLLDGDLGQGRGDLRTTLDEPRVDTVRSHEALALGTFVGWERLRQALDEFLLKCGKCTCQQQPQYLCE